MRQIFLLILLFIVGQWLVKALRRHDAQASQRTGAGANGAGGCQGPERSEWRRACRRAKRSRSSPSR